MSVQEIKEEIRQLELRIKNLNVRVKKIQQSCHHQYDGDEYYETCKKCGKVNALYY